MRPPANVVRGLRIAPNTFKFPLPETIIVGLPADAYSMSLLLVAPIGPTITVPPATSSFPINLRS